jgi:GNAT superfamily N-acetyltransferase
MVGCRRGNVSSEPENPLIPHRPGPIAVGGRATFRESSADSDEVPATSVDGMDIRPAPRRATLSDLEVVTDTIALAFAQDPVWAVAFARSDRRVDHQRALFRLWIEGALRYPWVWMTAGGEAVTIWIPPGGTDMSVEQEEAFDALAAENLGERAELLADLLRRFASAHPKAAPHYYLSLLGTHPAHRGQGIGMAPLADNLARIDAEGMPAYLESTNQLNDHRYERLGFGRLGEFESPFDKHVITTMWRPATGSGRTPAASAT